MFTTEHTSARRDHRVLMALRPTAFVAKEFFEQGRFILPGLGLLLRAEVCRAWIAPETKLRAFDGKQSIWQGGYTKIDDKKRNGGWRDFERGHPPFWENNRR